MHTIRIPVFRAAVFPGALMDLLSESAFFPVGVGSLRGGIGPYPCTHPTRAAYEPAFRHPKIYWGPVWAEVQPCFEKFAIFGPSLIGVGNRTKVSDPGTQLLGQSTDADHSGNCPFDAPNPSFTRDIEPKL